MADKNKAWADKTNYVVDDVVQHNGSTYICIQAHISSDDKIEPGIGANTRTYWEKKWAATKYEVGDAVQHNGWLYICIRDHTSSDKTKTEPGVDKKWATYWDRPKKVIVIGGGVAGLTAAHELQERGFDVHVYEQRGVVGGKARSMTDGRTGLPAEHGFRFFPGFYKHLTDTLSRIPYREVLYTSGDQERSRLRLVVDNLTNAGSAAFAMKGKPFFRFPTRRLGARRDLASALTDMFSDPALGVPPHEAAFAAYKLVKAMTMCHERREDELDGRSWWDYMRADAMSQRYRSVIVNGLTQNLVAIDAKQGSTKTVMNILARLLNDFMRADGTMDRVLNGPTSEVWFNKWRDYLNFTRLPEKIEQPPTKRTRERQKAVPTREGQNAVKFHTAQRVHSLDFNQKKNLVKAKLEDGKLVDGDYVIAAVPLEAMITILKKSPPTIQVHAPSLANLVDDPNLQTNWMSGIMYYLKDDVTMDVGHVLYIDSEWALTSISQNQFWRDKVSRRKQRLPTNGRTGPHGAFWRDKTRDQFINMAAPLSDPTLGVKLIEPGKSAESNLIRVLKGEYPATRRMPPGKEIPDEQIKQIADWIDDDCPTDGFEGVKKILDTSIGGPARGIPENAGGIPENAGGILSVIISDWFTISPRIGKSAQQTDDPNELAEETLSQIRDHLLGSTLTNIDWPNVVSFYVCPALEYSHLWSQLMGLMPAHEFTDKAEAISSASQERRKELDGELRAPGPSIEAGQLARKTEELRQLANSADYIKVNAEPLFINTVNSWQSRPSARTEIDNLFLASDYVKTSTDLATMEGANEAARRAVNALLDHMEEPEIDKITELEDIGKKKNVRRLRRCRIFTFDEPAIFAPFRRFDKMLYDRGLPQAFSRPKIAARVGKRLQEWWDIG